MLRSTKKEVKEVVRNYILDNVMAECESLGTDIQGICEWYNNGYWGNVSIGEFLVNYANVFTPYYEEQRGLLKEWLQETDEEASKYSNDQVSNTFIHLIDREIEKALGIKKQFNFNSSRQPFTYKEVK